MSSLVSFMCNLIYVIVRKLQTKIIKQKVARKLEKHGLKYRIDWNLSGKPFLTKPGKLLDALTTAIEQTTGITPQAETGGGTSDGRFIALMGAEVVEFGPLNATIHKVNECVSVDDLAKCGQIYHQNVSEFIGQVR